MKTLWATSKTSIDGDETKKGTWSGETVVMVNTSLDDNEESDEVTSGLLIAAAARRFWRRASSWKSTAKFIKLT